MPSELVRGYSRCDTPGCTNLAITPRRGRPARYCRWCRRRLSNRYVGVTFVAGR